MKIELSQNEVDLLLAGLSARKKRAKNRITNELRRGKTQHKATHEAKILEVERLYSRLQASCIS